MFFNGHNAVLTIGINMCCATDTFGIKIAYLLTYLLARVYGRPTPIGLIVHHESTITKILKPSA